MIIIGRSIILGYKFIFSINKSSLSMIEIKLFSLKSFSPFLTNSFGFMPNILHIFLISFFDGISTRYLTIL